MPDTAPTPFNLDPIPTLLVKFFYIYFVGGEIGALVEQRMC